MARSVARNTAFMTIASIGQKIVAFLYFTLIARYIGVEGTGKYFLALSFTTVFVIFVDLGLTNVLVRESAKLVKQLQAYFSTVLSVKLVLGVCTYLALLVSVQLFGYEGEIVSMIYLSGVTMLFDSLHLSMYGVLRAIGDLRYEAVSIVVSQLLTLILGGGFLYFGYPLIYLILAFTIPSALNALFVLLVLRYKFQVRFRPSFDAKIFAQLSRIALPFAIAAVLARLYSYADSILLSKLADAAAVGYYSVPYKMTYAFQFVPLALVAAVYPRFSEYFASAQDRLAKLFEQSLKYLFIVAMPIAVGVAILAKDIILTVYGTEYAPSILPLQVLIMSLIFSYLSFPVGAFLNACNRQVSQTWIVASVLVINVTTNLLLIPLYGPLGAAVAAFIGNVCLTMFGFFVVTRITTISFKRLAFEAFRITTSATVMGVLVVFVNMHAHFVFAIVAGALVYPCMLFLLRAVTTTQLREAFVMVRR